MRSTRRGTAGCGSAPRPTGPPSSKPTAMCAICPWPRPGMAWAMPGWTASSIGGKGGSGCRPLVADWRCAMPPAVRCSNACVNRRAGWAAWLSTASNRSSWTEPTSSGSRPGAAACSASPPDCRPFVTCLPGRGGCGIPPSTRPRPCRMAACGWPWGISASMRWTPAPCGCGARWPLRKGWPTVRCAVCCAPPMANSGRPCRRAASGARRTMPAGSSPWPKTGLSVAPAR